jgi:hypothetical protein
MARVPYDQLEQFARRGPGWGVAVALPQEDGTVLRMRVSLSNAFRNLIRRPEPTPRPSKGSAYVYGKDGVRRIVQ